MISEENRAAFLDRDGVINIDYGYVHKWEHFHFCEGAIEGMKILLSLNFKIIIITNQSGIARGIFSEEQYYELTKRYLLKLQQKGIQVTSVYHCPHHPSFSEKPFNECNCRKPKPGLFQKAINSFNFAVDKSIAIGDSKRDLIAAKRAGIKSMFLISSEDDISFEDQNISTHKSLLECSIYLKEKLSFPKNIST